jgi:hypothetical protein
VSSVRSHVCTAVYPQKFGRKISKQAVIEVESGELYSTIQQFIVNTGPLWLCVNEFILRLLVIVREIVQVVMIC